MNQNSQFDNKWVSTLNKDKSEEFSVFIKPGHKAKTQRQLFLYQYYSFIKDRFGDSAVRNSLEVGCGRGTVSLYFNLYDGSAITLTDISESAIDLAKRNISHHQASGEAVVAGADKLPFKNDSFDLVFSIGLLEHLDNYQEVVNEKYRVLEPGGMVASLNIPKKTSVQILNSWYRRVLGLFGRKESLKADYYRNEDSPEQYRQAFLKAGFKEVEVYYMTPLPLFTPLWAPIEYLVTLLYRLILFVRAAFLIHPFVAGKRTSQSHMIIARK